MELLQLIVVYLKPAIRFSHEALLQITFGIPNSSTK